MKQNIDCMKSVLRVLEKELTIQHFETSFYIDPVGIKRVINVMEESSSGFGYDEIAYAVLQLIERKYIVTTGMNIANSSSSCHITFGKILYITPEGHSFISG